MGDNEEIKLLGLSNRVVMRDLEMKVRFIIEKIVLVP